MNDVLPHYPQCFVCGHDNHRGLALNFHRDGENKVWSQFQAEAWMTGFKDIVHGGILSTLLDEAVIWAGYAGAGRFGMTADLSIRFKKPLLVGETCRIEAWLDSCNQKIWKASANAVHEKKGILASASAKIFPFSEEKQKDFSKYLKFV